MKIFLQISLPLRLPLYFLLAISACKEHEKEENKEADLLSQRAAFEIQPFAENLVPCDSLSFSAIRTDSSLKTDSLVLFLNESRVARLSPENLRFTAFTGNLGLGRHQFRLRGYLAGKENGSADAEFIFRSPEAPESWTYEVVKTLPHNPSSFTQGLEWHNGKLYEGTGLNGKSAVMEINPANGEALRTSPLGEEHFGEGITILENKLYQLTWQSHRAFVYKLPELEKISELGYPGEGWGLNHLNGLLLMSDGSERIEFHKPDDFSLVRSIQVWDHQNAVSELNELEVVDGFIYANKYQTDTIVKIDPVSGRVVAYLNLQGLLKPEDRKGGEDVLNGIAWNPADNLWYLTGKNWPKVFAVRWVRKKPA